MMMTILAYVHLVVVSGHFVDQKWSKVSGKVLFLLYQSKDLDLEQCVQSVEPAMLAAAVANGMKRQEMVIQQNDGHIEHLML